MPNEEALKAQEDGYPEKAEKWLKMLESHMGNGHATLSKNELEELYDTLSRTTSVCKAAAGDRLAIEHMVYNKIDGLNIGGSHWAAQVLTESLVGTIEEHDASNYVQLELNGHPKGSLLCTVQFRDKKTPADIAGERALKIEKLEKRIEELEAAEAQLLEAMIKLVK